MNQMIFNESPLETFFDEEYINQLYINELELELVEIEFKLQKAKEKVQWEKDMKKIEEETRIQHLINSKKEEEKINEWIKNQKKSEPQFKYKMNICGSDINGVFYKNKIEDTKDEIINNFIRFLNNFEGLNNQNIKKLTNYVKILYRSKSEMNPEYVNIKIQKIYSKNKSINDKWNITFKNIYNKNDTRTKTFYTNSDVSFMEWDRQKQREKLY